MEIQKLYHLHPYKYLASKIETYSRRKWFLKHLQIPTQSCIPQAAQDYQKVCFTGFRHTSKASKL